MTGRSLLEKLKLAGKVEHAFRFPYCYIRCISSQFDGLEEEDRELLACKAMERSVAEVRKTAADCMFTLQWMTQAEATQQPIENRGEHWLRALLIKPTPTVDTGVVIKTISVSHFFGYKGGQGRSTVLACLAEKLAHEGARVLVLDADIEAPSLDVLFGRKASGPSATLLGIVQNPTNIMAIPALQGKDGGEVRLIACRPRESAYDIDFAAFALQTGLVPGILEEAIHQIETWAVREGFNAILVDHRSGMSMTTLTWMKLLPGPAVVFAKLDEQWRGAEDILREVLQADPANPGVIVTFKPDEETEDSFRRRTIRARSDLLSLMNETIVRSLKDDDNISDNSMIEDRWLLWPYDQAFRATPLPDLSSLGSGTKNILSELTRLLEISIPEKKKLSSTGSIDKGDLIQTEALKTLRQTNNSIRYIFGRKGTGKTRLAKQLADEGLGETLLADASSEGTSGITTAEVEFSRAKDHFRKDPEGLWWAILLAALQSPTTERKSIRSNLTNVLSDASDTSSLMREVLNALPASGNRIFLFDGIETAFSVSDVYVFVENLFRFMLTLQSDDRFIGRIEVKLFLRTDLASRVQNLEQQVDGRVIYLYWDYQRILNFLLSRLPHLDFFKKTFQETIKEIDGMRELIRSADVASEEAERILLQILPAKLRQFHILTSTFLRLHFADSSGQGASYYPRVVDSFLKNLNANGLRNETKALVEGRLDQGLIIQAHEQASADYMNQIRQELEHLLNFEQPTPEANHTKLDDWIKAFTSQSTPFLVDEMERHLSERITISPVIARRCLRQMLTLGIFESSTDSPNTWRTGRLFKSSLKMKYKRVGTQEAPIEEQVGLDFKP